MEPWHPQPAPDGSANFRFNDYCPNRKNVNPNRMKSVPPAPYAVGAVNHAVAIGDARFAVACEEGRAVEVDDVAKLADKIGRRHRQAGAHHVADHYVEPQLPRLARDRQSLGQAAARSEEHTSELQSLMRISYAVFCLKKKKKRHEPQYN